jgi:glycosyltransferase involved in cell wall biosynthesis
MRILSITAGMYCGSCLRDNAFAVECLARGHEVTLLPLYTPTNPDEENVSRDEVLFGGISIYMQQRLAMFRHTPRFLDRWWDSPRVIKAFASRSLSTDPKLLGDLMISMLEADRGVLRKEFDKLLDWLKDEPVPDVINLPNSLLIGLAGPLKRALNRPVCCTLQGEDLFLENLLEPYRSRAIELIHRQAPDVDRFIAVSDSYVPVMSKMLGIPESRMSVVPLGINLKGYERGKPAEHVFRVGYFARIAPEKGLQALADAYVLFRKRTAGSPVRLEAAGYLPRDQHAYLDGVRNTIGRAGLGAELTYHGAVDRGGKLSYLRTLDLLSVPATYDEPKGVFLLEAMASGVPVVQPRRGAFTEIVERTGGGLLVAPDDPAALADGLYRLWQDRALRDALAERAFSGVRAHYSIAKSCDRLIEVYEAMIAAAGVRSGDPVASASRMSHA